MTPTVRPEYLDSAADAGLLHQLDGHPFVAGEYHDEAGGERQCLVEYCAAELLTDGAGPLTARLTGDFPEVDVIVLRAAGDVVLPAPWLTHLTYVRFAGDPAAVTVPAGAGPDPVVTAAGPEHDPAILRWLIQAFDTYGDEQRHHGDPATVRATAQRVLEATDRHSYVATVDNRAVGHVTLLGDGYDDMTGGRYVELLDTLVEAEPELRRAAVVALTAAAVAHAARVGLPLVGHVVHATVDPAKGEGVVRSLLGRGWAVDHRYWRRPPADREAAA